jgi:hypothetical protein
MTEHCYCGIDVAKDRLDVMVLPDRKSFSVDNNAAGYSELVKRLRGLSIAAIGIEPSGGYERAVKMDYIRDSRPAKWVKRPICAAKISSCRCRLWVKRDRANSRQCRPMSAMLR